MHLANVYVSGHSHFGNLSRHRNRIHSRSLLNGMDSCWSMFYTSLYSHTKKIIPKGFCIHNLSYMCTYTICGNRSWHTQDRVSHRITLSFPNPIDLSSLLCLLTSPIPRPSSQLRSSVPAPSLPRLSLPTRKCRSRGTLCRFRYLIGDHNLDCSTGIGSFHRHRSCWNTNQTIFRNPGWGRPWSIWNRTQIGPKVSIE
jgi:hypothetical protein